MGNESSQPISILNSLGTEDLTGNKDFFDQLFDPKNAELLNKPGISKQLTQYYQQKPDNFIEFLKQTISHLSDFLSKSDKKQNENESNSIKSNISIFSLLRIILPLLVNSNYGHQKLSEIYQDEKSLGSTLFLICTKIFIQSSEKYDDFSLYVLECIIILIRCSYNSNESTEQNEDFNLLVNKIKENVIKILKNYHSSKNIDKKSSQKNIQLMLIFLELINDNIIIKNSENMKIEWKQLFDTIIQNINKQNGLEELKSIFLPLSFQLYFNYLKIIENESRTEQENSLIDNEKINNQILINLLHLVDINGKSSIAKGCFYVLSLFLSLEPIKKCLNLPCSSFESSWPVHRGSLCDLIIEIVTRYSTLNQTLLHSCVDCISTIIPSASNISYVSAVSLMKLISKGSELKDEYIIDNIIKAIHFAINRSIRENVPLVIVLLKNSKMFLQMHKLREDFEELASLVTFVKNVNQELKQMGTTFKSAELEAFFQDPACEHFANPVLKPPELDYINDSHYKESIYCMVDTYISKEILGINEVLSIPEIPKDK